MFRAMQPQIRRSKEEAAGVLRGYESDLREAEREGGCAFARRPEPGARPAGGIVVCREWWVGLGLPCRSEALAAAASNR